MNKSLRIFLIALVGLSLALWIIIPRLNLSDNENPKTGPIASSAPKAVPVEVVIVKPQTFLNSLQVTGSVVANETVDLKPEGSGIIEQIHFKEGQRVKKGELLLTLNDDKLQAQYNKLRYTKKLYEDSEYRQRVLLEKEAISQQEYDRALTELNTAEADLQLIQAQLADMKIRAPFDGVIGLRKVSEGAYVNPSTSIVQLYNIDPIKLDFAIPGKYSAIIKTGTKVFFTTDAIKEPMEGEVYAIEPQVDPATRTLQIRALAKNSQQNVFPGEFAKIEMVLEKKENALLLPTSAVIPILNGYKVFVARNGKAEELTIETGIRTDTNLEILSGLQEGDTIITTGLLQMRVGTPVSVTVTSK
ncbi:efflux RND transporter periplasmic adaptor subunit [Cytophagales bacterium LB-30]|uniref:Efflux RND transporter periplasmic adaptor subunit n=1 Tax=Shiella aurantiaca TaxID=3058365 RepID=A0ABT8F5H8_9BACT|nr:efflux RND transporter periplasmic adaptor subunit [Shiella aurantiaca]MDN4165619.1 efflux RND transporter periplasmic adaptor subunit [Shiella aurantiaca]